ncbi:MAG: hypothetical protein KatS3mg105_0683 [Gemmatales bacterium]|nr:MAG: hypothetical protein KatS3mg105_0683 [Gemmatales bacterium]
MIALTDGFLLFAENAADSLFPRGPGFYFSFSKILAVAVVYLAWIKLCAWADTDAQKLRLPASSWNLAMLAGGMAGLLILWLLPLFLLGFLTLVVLSYSPVFFYIVFRDRHVPQDQRILTETFMKRLIRRYFYVEEDEDEPVSPKRKKPTKDRPKLSTEGLQFFRRGGRQDDSPYRGQQAHGLPGYSRACRLLKEAIRRRASDIHLEPSPKEVAIRFRIDGVMQPVETLTPADGEAVAAACKFLAELEPAANRKQQTGSFCISIGKTVYDIRVDALSTVSGEKVVLRLYDRANANLRLEELGLPSDAVESIYNFLDLPQGMLLVSGPNHSGRTTTLYAILQEVDRSQKSVVTLEEFVEQRLQGITQVEMDLRTGGSQSSALRALLDQNPDVLLISELRDRETADLACQASVSGKLILSSVTAPDAATGLLHLVELGVAETSVAAAVKCVISQRLVHLLCEHCRILYQPSAEALRHAGLPAGRIKHLYRPRSGTARTFRCKKCAGRRFLRRTGVFEFLAVNEPIRQLLLHNTNPETLLQVAKRAGMKPLVEELLHMLLEGRITLQEWTQLTS